MTPAFTRALRSRDMTRRIQQTLAPAASQLKRLRKVGLTSPAQLGGRTRQAGVCIGTGQSRAVPPAFPPAGAWKLPLPSQACLGCSKEKRGPLERAAL